MRTARLAMVLSVFAAFAVVLEGIARVEAQAQPPGALGALMASAVMAPSFVPGPATNSEKARSETSGLVDPCNGGEVVASPSRPMWDGGAVATPCGNLETDYGWQYQPMGMGVRQQVLMSSIRYGLTQRMELRWGMVNQIAQRGGGTRPLKGVGDQCLSTTYRFLDQGAWRPAMAVSYGAKIPTANPAKGFGSGFVDHQFVLLASRDLGKSHVDFNMVGIVAGAPRGHEGAAQFGMALSRPVSGRLTLILESCGGPQPGTSNRFGAALAGATFNLRPNLVVDAAYSRQYTAGAPREMVLAGITWARRLRLGPTARNSTIARLLGRQ